MTWESKIWETLDVYPNNPMNGYPIIEGIHDVSCPDCGGGEDYGRYEIKNKETGEIRLVCSVCWENYSD